MHTSDPMLLTIGKLKQQRAKIDKLIDQLQTVRALYRRAAALTDTTEIIARPKRKWSAQQRAKFVKTMHAHWKARRNDSTGKTKDDGATLSKGKTTKTKRRKPMSAGARKKLAQAARLRWKKQKASGRTSGKLTAGVTAEKGATS